jgi:hypothetical protein
VIQNSDNLGGMEAGGRRKLAQSAIMLASAAAALVAPTTEAAASAREVGVSYGFADSLLASNGLEQPLALSQFGAGAPRCLVSCGAAFGAYFVRRSDLLTSNTADLSVRKTADANGHSMGLGGVIVVERLESDASGSLTNWVVVSERTVDENGSHSWSLWSSHASLDAPWLPSDLYRFEGSSFSTDLAAGGTAGPTPEPSTWMMLLMGLAGIAFARIWNSRNWQFSTPARKGAQI